MDTSKKYVDIDYLRSAGDLKVNLLALIFDEVAAGYKEHMGSDLFVSRPPVALDPNAQTVSLEQAKENRFRKDISEVEQRVFGIDGESALVDAFKRGREYHFQEAACRFSAQYSILQKLINEALKNRGFGHLWVY